MQPRSQVLSPTRLARQVGENPGNEVYRYVPRHAPPKRVGFLGLFGLKRAIYFAHFGLELGMVFRGNYESV